MKYFYAIVFFLAISTGTLHAQELFIEGGKSITSFSFKDVILDELDNLRSTNHNYIDLGYRGKLFGDQVQFIGGIGLHTYGSVGSDNTQNTYFEWETTYASLHGGIDIKVIQARRFSFHLRATVAPEIMLQGTRVLNNQVLDIKGAEDFDTPIIFLRGAASFEYKINNSIAAFFQYRYGQGTQLEKSDTGGELTYFSQDFGLGLIFSIKKGESEEDTPEDSK